ncbi:MAG: N5-carboxyaminoimidazole ribonucleotide mutase [Planctomycetes bacterium]|nr:N5-carboxyaminoimidazole ribonucleotide mutase [Planctomycetota bacterium]
MSPAASEGPVRVCVLMGSDSDLPVMKKCLEQLDRLQVRWDCVVASAHRTPERVVKYVGDMERQGCLCFVAAAGGAAHLAGAVAAQTTLPVIGVPMAVPPFDGLDALFSTVQMPPGMPVATVAAGDYGAHNAGLLAAQIVSIADPALRDRIRKDRESTKVKVVEKNRKMRSELGLGPGVID